MSVPDEIKNLPGLKEDELQVCAQCGRHHTAPVFYRITVENCAMDMSAMQRQVGLGMALGGHAALANIMGPNDDMAKIMDTTTKILCLDCASELPVLALI